MQAVKFEHLDAGIAAPQTLFLPEDRLREIKNAAYETGRAEGFAEARGRNDETRKNLLRDISQQLERFDFNHVEARQAVLRSLEPLLNALLTKLLPALVDASFLAKLQDEIMTVAAERTDGRLELCCNPTVAEILKSQLSADAGILPRINLITDDSMTDHAARVTYPGGGREIDLDNALVEIAASVQAFFGLLKEEQAYG